MKKFYLFIMTCLVLMAGAWSTGAYGKVYTGEFPTGKWSVDYATDEMFIERNGKLYNAQGVEIQ